MQTFIRRLAHKLRYPQLFSKTFVRLGSEYGGWWVETAKLHPESHVLSAGIGEDATFDLELISRFQCNVLALDPTPKAIAYTKQFANNKYFHFKKTALADTDGEIFLTPPEREDFASYSAYYIDTKKASFPFQATSLKTILREQHWNGFDLVKLDIEGGEYSVIDNIIDNVIPINQLCVEFHDDIAAQIGRSTSLSIQQLRRYHMKLVYRENQNYTFLRSI